MKKMNKVLTMVFAGVMLATCAFGCGGNADKPDLSKTQLNVEVVDVGTGTKYVKNLAKRFEEYAKDKSYEDGKKGVEIRLTPRKGYLSVDSFTAKEYDVFFNYEAAALQDWIRDGHVLDITDIAEKPLSEFGETRSIKDKMHKGAEDFYGYDGKIYALPTFVHPFGIMYDEKVFEDEKLYFKDGGGFTNGKDNDKTAGQDGIKGTNDDGLPRTYDEFFTLCDKMLDKGLQPLTWTGTYRDYYLENFIQAAHADAGGYDATRMFYTFDGEATDLIESIGADGKLTFKPKTTITNKNGYELWSQSGVYYATSFIERMMKKNAKGNYYYDYNKQHGTYSNIEAEEDFLITPYEPTTKTIAMLLEGMYWENEIAEYGTFDYMSGTYEGASRAERRLAYMPFPKPTEELVGTGHTVIDDNFGVALGNNHMEEYKKELAKEFIRFCYTDESLQETTVTTSLFFSMDYKMTEENYNKLSNYGKSIADYMSADDTKVVVAVTKNPLYMDNINRFNAHYRYVSTVCNEMFKGFADNAYNAKQVFEGMKEYRQKGWSDYSKYFK